MSDLYTMKRGWMEHGVFKEAPYSHRESWAWLIENAAWKEHETNWKGKTIALKRGQVPTSLRNLERDWGWSQNKILRWIGVLKTEAMIEVSTAAGFYIITILNYDDYQLSKEKAEAGTEARAEARAEARTDANRIKNNNVNKDNNTTPTPSGQGRRAGKSSNEKEPELIKNLPTQHKEPCRFESEFWPLCPRRENKKKAKEAYDAARLKDTQANIIAGMRIYRRRYENDNRPKDEKDRYYKWPQGWLNEERWKDLLEQQQEADAEDEMPKNMTPEEHAKWCAERLGLWRIQ